MTGARSEWVAFLCDRYSRPYKTTIFSPVCGWCLPTHPILEKKQ
jgi:hypothetical protein